MYCALRHVKNEGLYDRGKGYLNVKSGIRHDALAVVDVQRA